MLPFETIEQAQAFLGRPLTYSETLWFNYSAKMPDFVLHCHIFLFVVIIFCIVPLPLVFIDLNKWKLLQKYKLQPRVYVTKSEFLQYFKSAMFIYFTAIWSLQFSSFPVVKLIGIRTNLSLPSIWEIIAQLVVYFMVDHFVGYWIHRWMHSEWAFENIHKLHHEFTAPVGFVSSAVHWAEIMIAGVPAFAGPAIAPCHMITLWLWIVLRHLENLDTHTGYDFPWSLTKLIPFYGGAQFHDYHHYIGGQSRCNFAAIFAYCDYVYQTNKGYKYQMNLLLKTRKTYLNGGMETHQNEKPYLVEGDNDKIL